MQPSDEDLIRACRANDPAAWEALVGRYQRLVWSVPRRAGLGEDLAAEVFQRVFANLVRQLGRLDQPDRLSAWLTTVAKRETWRVLRQETSAATVPLGGLDGDGSQDEPATPEELLPEELLIQLEEQQQVRQALATLDDRCRRLLTMLYFQVETPAYTDVAAALGTSVGSIGPTRARCLEKMRKLLDTAGF